MMVGELCGCGKPVRYTSRSGGACNKYMRCPTYEELKQAAERFRRDAHQLRIALSLAGTRCKDVHHELKHRHEFDEACPVEAFINEAIKGESVLNTTPSTPVSTGRTTGI